MHNLSKFVWPLRRCLEVCFCSYDATNGAPGLTTRSKDATEGSWTSVPAKNFHFMQNTISLGLGSGLLDGEMEVEILISIAFAGVGT